MDCTRFREWLPLRDQASETASQAAELHSQRCPGCARLLDADRAAERCLQAGLARVEVPAGLRLRVSMLGDPQTGNEPKRWRWPVFAVPSLAAAMLLMVLVLPLRHRLDSIDRIAQLAADNHGENMVAQFSATEVEDVPAWFRDRLGFEVRVPALENAEFAGGRQCSVGRSEAAYLFYDRDGKRLSLFEIPAGEVEMNLEEGRPYRYPVKQWDVEIWREGERTYVLVE
jgi:hypothetical protein